MELFEAQLRHEDPIGKLRKEVRELQNRNTELLHKYTDACMALGIVTSHFPPFNEVTRKRAQDLLDRRKVEWESRAAGQGALK